MVPAPWVEAVFCTSGGADGGTVTVSAVWAVSWFCCPWVLTVLSGLKRDASLQMAMYLLHEGVEVPVVVSPVSSSDHDVIPVVEDSWYARDNFGNLCVKQVLAADAAKCQSFVPVVFPGS